MLEERTQVAIVGGGPAGLLLSQLLHLAGVRSVVLERRDRAYCENRVRAGVLDHKAVEILRAADITGRMDEEGLRHEGIELRFDGAGHRIPLTELTGRHITVYGQQEVVKDLIARRLADDGDVRFEVEDLAIHDVGSDKPSVTFTQAGRDHQLFADLIAGCDGSHGPSRPTLSGKEFLRTYPFAWLGILVHATPRSEELIYALHERGFALYSMRSREVTRLYLQVDADETVDNWPEDRIWEELSLRFGLGGEPWDPGRGDIFDVGLTSMRSMVVEPMQRGRLLLAGDAAHIVPPTGAKGLNLAIRDVWLMARAIEHWYATGDESLLDSYSRDALAHVWRGEYFAWWMTSMLHRDPGEDVFHYRLQLAQLENVVSSPAYSAALAENYAG